MKSILKLTSSHQKCPICWIIFLSENPSWSFIPSSTTIMNPPPGSTELPGSKASRWRRGGGSPSWDKICNGPVKGLKTEWQALPRGFRALQDSKTFFVDSGRWNGSFWLGENTISLENQWNATLKTAFVSLFYIKKLTKFCQDDLRSLDHERLASSPKSHSPMHRDAVVSRFSSVALKPWSTVQSAFLRGS